MYISNNFKYNDLSPITNHKDGKFISFNKICLKLVIFGAKKI
jgi:hypothetical protein